MSRNWTIGMALNFVGSITINLGTNLMKYSHIINESHTLSLSNWQKHSWTIGIVIFSIGNAFNFMSFGYAAQSLLACIGSIQFVSNVIFAFSLLDEKVTRRVVEGTCVIVLGNTFTLLFASHESKNYSVDELYVMYKQTSFIVYICFVFVAAVGLTLVYYKLDYDKNAGDTRKTLKQIGCYSITSAMIGSLGVLLAKSLSQLLRTTMTGDNQFIYFFTYFVFFGWIGLTIFWMERLNSGLRKFPSMIIVPALQVFWTVFSILSGGIYFGEFADFSWMQTIGFSCGVIIIISGVHHLAPFNAEKIDMLGDTQDIHLPLDKQRPTELRMNRYEDDDDDIEPINELSSETNPFLSHDAHDNSLFSQSRTLKVESEDDDSLYSSDITSTRWTFHLPSNVDVGISTPLVVMTHNARTFAGITMLDDA